MVDTQTMVRYILTLLVLSTGMVFGQDTTKVVIFETSSNVEMNYAPSAFKVGSTSGDGSALQVSGGVARFSGGGVNPTSGKGLELTYDWKGSHINSVDRNSGFLLMPLYISASKMSVNGSNLGIGLSSDSLITANLDIRGINIRLRLPSTPLSSAANGNQGEMKWDSNYFYICVSTNNWKRIPLQSF